MGAGVKVTDVPAQMVVALAEMETAGVTTGFTIIVTEFEVAVVGEAQVAVDVITQVITSPLTRAELL